MPIVSPQVCGGHYRVSLPYALVSRVYENDCLIEAKFDVEKIASARDFSQILKSMSDILRYEVCLETKTSLDNADNIHESEKPNSIILEKWNKFPREIRFEDSVGNGFEIEENDCSIIPDWATGTMVIEPMTHIFHKMDGKLFNKLMSQKFLSEVEGENNLFENRLFIENTEVYAKPRHILKFIYIGLVLTWLVTITTLATLVIQLRKIIQNKIS